MFIILTNQFILDMIFISELQNALQDLYRLVIGECPSLLDEDSGGDINLAMKIEELLYK